MGLFSAPLKIEIHVEPPAVGRAYAPGEAVEGVVTLTSAKSFALKAVRIELEGACTTRVYHSGDTGAGDAGGGGSGGGSGRGRSDADDDFVRSQLGGDRSATETVPLVKESQELFPPAEHRARLASTGGKSSKAVTLQRGQHDFKFRFTWPHEIAPQPGSVWSGQPLPPSLQLGSDLSASVRVEYGLRVTASVPGLLASSSSETKVVPLLFLNEGPPGGAAGGAVVAQRAATLRIYDRERETWLQFAGRALGLSTHSHEVRLRARLVHPAAGLPEATDASYPVGRHLRIELLRLAEGAPGTTEKAAASAEPPAAAALPPPGWGEKVQSGAPLAPPGAAAPGRGAAHGERFPLVVSALRLSMASTCEVRSARLPSRRITNSVDVASVANQAYALHFDSNGVCDLAPLFGAATLPPSLPPAFHGPNFDLAYDLQLRLTVQATSGAPIEPVSVGLTSRVPLYSTKPSPLSRDAPPPPPYAA